MAIYALALCYVICLQLNAAVATRSRNCLISALANSCMHITDNMLSSLTVKLQLLNDIVHFMGIYREIGHCSVHVSPYDLLNNFLNRFQ